MKTKLRLFLAAAALGASATAFCADEQPAPPAPPPQSPPPPPAAQPPAPGEAPRHWEGRRMDPQRQIDRLSEKLSLTDDQKAKILPLLQAQNEQIKAVLKDDSLTKKDQREKVHDIITDTRGKIRALLTPDQQTKFDEMRPGREGHESREGAPPPSPDNDKDKN